MNKIKKIQIFRAIIQILMLIILPGLFIMAFNGLKDIVGMIKSGNFNSLQALPSLIEFISVTALSVLFGRFFCGWLCAFGTFGDIVYILSKTIFKTKFRISERMDSYLKNVKYVVLGSIILVSCILESTLFSSMSPWDAFAQLTDFPDILFTIPLGVLILVLITVGSFFIERFFCRYLCPLGAFFSLVSGFSIFKINKPTEKCGKCRICTNNCSMGLQLYQKESIRGGECINCMKCVEACPRKNPCPNIINQDVNPAFASSVALSVFTGLYGLSSLGGYVIDMNNLSSANTAVSGNISSSANTASASGSNSASTGSASSSTGTSSGSNSSSTGSAGSSTKSYNSAAYSSSASGSTSTASSAAQQGKYKDGTYTGSATGFKGGTTKMSVTVSGGSITSIKTLSTYDTPRFYNNCEQTIINKIVASQSTSVDTVSGATYSSKGIINAVKNALSNAAV